MKAKKFGQTLDGGGGAAGPSDKAQTARGQKRVNVDFPAWMVESLDKEANRLGVTRQSIIKVWLAERLERAAAEQVGEEK
jgi:hypothetical protein